MKLWRWQLLGLTAFLAPLAAIGTAAAISRGHAGLVAAPAILSIVLVVHLVRRASAAAVDLPRPRGEDARSQGTEAPRPWRHRENGTLVPGQAADQASTDADRESSARVPLARH